MGDATRPAKKRRYRQRKRAEQQAATRRRIVDAAIELHGTVGFRRTTMTAIAERAGVQRNTLYRHFPDEVAVGQACSSLWYERNPPPDTAALARIRDPHDRLRAALRETDAYYRRTHGMLASLARDQDDPLLWEVAAPLRDEANARRDVVVDGFRVRGRRRELLCTAVELALDFETWRTVVQRRGLPSDEAVELLARMVEAAAGPRSGKQRDRSGDGR